MAGLRERSTFVLVSRTVSTSLLADRRVGMRRKAGGKPVPATIFERLMNRENLRHCPGWVRMSEEIC